MNRPRRITLLAFGLGFMAAGAMHFIKPKPYIRIMPPQFPKPAELVAISGVFEILGGLGLLLPPVRRPAAWGLVALLVAVFPANIYMTMDPVKAGAGDIPRALLWARLPLQPLMIWGVLWCTKDSARLQS